jgi:hypothetical protein
MLGRGIPRVSPWAGVHCPFGGKRSAFGDDGGHSGGVQIYSLFLGRGQTVLLVQRELSRAAVITIIKSLYTERPESLTGTG